MLKDSKDSSVRKRILNYFDFLSCYESEIPLSAPLEIKQPVQPRAEGNTTRQSATSGLNPYPAYAPYKSLAQMEAEIKGCLRCPLGSTRNKFVFGTGSNSAKVVFIGEAPGAEEDRLGEPFVGRAGKLLDYMLEQIEWSRQEVHICNILKCRPPNNRDPQPDEINTCVPYLHEQLRLLEPDWLVALGRISAQVLLSTTAPLKALRGRVHKYRGKPFWVTYHPAALLRNQAMMPDAHQDLLTLKKMVVSGTDDFEAPAAFEGEEL